MITRIAQSATAISLFLIATKGRTMLMQIFYSVGLVTRWFEKESLETSLSIKFLLLFYGALVVLCLIFGVILVGLVLGLLFGALRVHGI